MSADVLPNTLGLQFNDSLGQAEFQKGESSSSDGPMKKIMKKQFVKQSIVSSSAESEGDEKQSDIQQKSTAPQSMRNKQNKKSAPTHKVSNFEEDEIQDIFEKGQKLELNESLEGSPQSQQIEYNQKLNLLQSLSDSLQPVADDQSSDQSPNQKVLKQKNKSQSDKSENNNQLEKSQFNEDSDFIDESDEEQKFKRKKRSKPKYDVKITNLESGIERTERWKNSRFAMKQDEDLNEDENEQQLKANGELCIDASFRDKSQPRRKRERKSESSKSQNNPNLIKNAKNRLFDTFNIMDQIDEEFVEDEQMIEDEIKFEDHSKNIKKKQDLTNLKENALKFKMKIGMISDDQKARTEVEIQKLTEQISPLGLQRSNSQITNQSNEESYKQQRSFQQIYSQPTFTQQNAPPSGTHHTQGNPNESLQSSEQMEIMNEPQSAMSRIGGLFKEKILLKKNSAHLANFLTKSLESQPKDMEDISPTEGMEVVIIPGLERQSSFSNSLANNTLFMNKLSRNQNSININQFGASNNQNNSNNNSNLPANASFANLNKNNNTKIPNSFPNHQISIKTNSKKDISMSREMFNKLVINNNKSQSIDPSQIQELFVQRGLENLDVDQKKKNKNDMEESKDEISKDQANDFDDDSEDSLFNPDAFKNKDEQHNQHSDSEQQKDASPENDDDEKQNSNQLNSIQDHEQTLKDIEREKKEREKHIRQLLSKEEGIQFQSDEEDDEPEEEADDESEPDGKSVRQQDGENDEEIIEKDQNRYDDQEENIDANELDENDGLEGEGESEQIFQKLKKIAFKINQKKLEENKKLEQQRKKKELREKKRQQREEKQKELKNNPQYMEIINGLLDQEAELGSDNEDNDGIIKNIDKDAELREEGLEGIDLDQDLKEIINNASDSEDQDADHMRMAKFMKDLKQRDKEQLRMIIHGNYKGAKKRGISAIANALQLETNERFKLQRIEEAQKKLMERDRFYQFSNDPDQIDFNSNGAFALDEKLQQEYDEAENIIQKNMKDIKNNTSQFLNDSMFFDSQLVNKFKTGVNKALAINQFSDLNKQLNSQKPQIVQMPSKLPINSSKITFNNSSLAANPQMNVTSYLNKSMFINKNSVLGIMKNQNNISQLNDNIDAQALNEFGTDNLISKGSQNSMLASNKANDQPQNPSNFKNVESLLRKPNNNPTQKPDTQPGSSSLNKFFSTNNQIPIRPSPNKVLSSFQK